MTDVKISFNQNKLVKKIFSLTQIGLALKSCSKNVEKKKIFYLYESSKKIDQILLDTCSIIITDCETNLDFNKPVIVIDDFEYIIDGSVLSISRAGKIRVLFNPHSSNNALFVTEACNNYCLMCPQPPRPLVAPNIKDHLIEIIHLIREEDAPKTLGITGGEPTIIHHELIDVMKAVVDKFPDTVMQLLSNGRLFSYQDYAKEMSILSSNMFIGIPLYGATSDIHDYVVQCKGAFNQTMAGIYECRRNNIDIELRVVLNKYTIGELKLIVDFIKRNLPFVKHIALMGMENMGLAKINYSHLWVDPVDFKQELRDGVLNLVNAGISTSVFNLPYCILDNDIWDYAKQSISDYKIVYMEQCNNCSKKEKCSGLFSSTSDKYRLTDPVNILPII